MGQTTLRDYLQAIEDALSSGRIEDALDNCHLILAHYPHSLEAQRLLGEVYLAQGQLEQAQQAFDWVLTNDPENVVTYCSRALISERMQDYDTALDCYQEAYELSRGNSGIRQQFNQLSLKIGQNHFVFSRAGLARLYMRGDLLPQAIQEWEAVLAAAPERLDAQTGLLETYWREGLYDRVEQLARQILEGVPGCLKALLLLAHVTYAQNTGQAQHYIQLAESLDPDMIMAQELFSDAIASQPADPFWALLKKAPTVISKPQAEPVAAAVSASNGVSNHGERGAVAYADSLARWDSMDTIIEPPPEHQPGQNAASLFSWTETGNGKAVWDSDPDQIPTHPEKEDRASSWQQNITPEDATSEGSGEEAAAAFALFDDKKPGYDASSVSQDAITKANAGQYWPKAEPIEEESTWVAQSPVPETNEPAAPPAWLEMLTSSGWKQTAGYQEDEHEDIVVEQTYEEQQPVPPEPQVEPTFAADSSAEIQMEAPDFSEAPFSSVHSPVYEDEDEISFGPEWLRSLGASLISEEPSPASSQGGLHAESLSLYDDEEEAATLITPATQPEARIEEPPFVEPAQTNTHDVVPAYSPILRNEPASKKDIAREEVRQPASVGDWISQAAEQLSHPDQNVLNTLEALENDLRSRGFVPLEPGTLSAFAQDEEPIVAQPGTPTEPPVRATTKPLELIAQEPTSEEETPEPLWPAVPPQTPQQPQPGPEFAPSASTTQPIPQSQPATRPDKLLDVDLETTMKSPAIRLQPMGQRSSSHSTSTLRGRTGERAVPGQASSNSLSSKERLLKGYQYQLAGDYDEAMQEYRVIIRSAPELVGEVISNVRALLKISPKFGPGYRVLGDAYMRQGEYLQAMEAYNKALAMTRRVR